MLKTYRASGHCGKVVVEASLDLEQSSSNSPARTVQLEQSS